MKKSLSMLLTVVLIFSFSFAMVSAQVTDFFPQDGTAYSTVDRGTAEYVSPLTQKNTALYYWKDGVRIYNTGCVNLTASSLRIPGVPYTITNAICNNDLVFRAYQLYNGDLRSAGNTVNFRYKNPSITGCRMYPATTLGGDGCFYYLKCSLNSTSASDSVSFMGRWNP